MECLEETLLLRIVDGDASKEEMQVADVHIDSCEMCRQTVAVLAQGSAPLVLPQGDDLDLDSDSIAGFALGADVASGGMGRITAARDEQFGRNVVVKRAWAKDGSQAARFRREANITARLQHPGVVPVYRAGTTSSGEAYYIMRHVSGRTLADKLAVCTSRRERMQLLPAVLSVAETISYAHEMNIVHRDLKPSNIIVGNHGEVVVIDWGLAKELGSEDLPANTHDFAEYSKTGDPRLTADGTVVGTPYYMPPEQARAEPVDKRGDVYALGAIVYQLLCGQAPYQDVAPASVMPKLLAGPPTPIRQKESNLAPELVSIVDQAMERNADQRFPSASELGEQLSLFLGGKLVESHEYSAGLLLRRWIARHKAAVVVAAILSFALLGLASVGTYKIAKERDRANLQAERASLEAQRANQEATRATEESERANLEAEQSNIVADFLVGLFRAARPDTSRGKAVSAVDLLPLGVENARKLSHQGLKGRVLYTIGQAYHELGRYKQEQPLLAEAVVALSEHWGPEGKPTLIARHGQARLHYAIGEYEEAETLHLEIYKTRQELFGMKDKDTLRSADSLAGLYIVQGRYKEALPLYETTLGFAMEALGADHEQTLSTRGNVALSYLALGEADKAEPILLESIAEQTRVLGEDHPNTIHSLSTLAMLYQDQKKFEEAERIGRKGLALCTRVYGKDDSRTFYALDGVAKSVDELGRYKEAGELYQQVLTGLSNNLGRSHPNIPYTLRSLAGLRKKQGEFTTSRDLLLEARVIQNKKLRPGHRSIGISAYELALVYQALHQDQQADGLFAEAEQILTANNADKAGRVKLLREWAQSLSALGRETEASALKLRAKALEDETPAAGPP